MRRVNQFGTRSQIGAITILLSMKGRSWVNRYIGKADHLCDLIAQFLFTAANDIIHQHVCLDVDAFSVGTYCEELKAYKLMVLRWTLE